MGILDDVKFEYDQWQSEQTAKQPAAKPAIPPAGPLKPATAPTEPAFSEQQREWAEYKQDLADLAHKVDRVAAGSIASSSTPLARSPANPTVDRRRRRNELVSQLRPIAAEEEAERRRAKDARKGLRRMMGGR